MQSQPCEQVALCLELGVHSAKLPLIQMLLGKQEAMAFITQRWAIRLCLALPNEGATRVEDSRAGRDLGDRQSGC